MAFFTKLKKAKEAAAEHKKEAATQEQPKPKVPYKHVPVHAGADALSATPTTIRAEELRERIAAARRSRSVSSASGVPRSGTALYQTVNSPASRSRPSSIASSPSHSRNGSIGKRTNSDLSISTMMNSYPEAPSRGRQPARRDYFSHSSGVPTVPQLPAQHRPKPQTVSSRSSVTKRRSPLSAMSITEDDEAGEPSSSSSQASDSSVASSQSSTTEISRPNSSQDQVKEINKDQNYSRPLSAIASAPTVAGVAPQSQQKKQQATIEIAAQPDLTKRKSMRQRFSMFSRKSMVVAAH